MLYFQIPENFKNYEKWTDQLKDWCVAYKLEFLNVIDVPILIEGNREVTGEKEISQFLKDYRSYMNDWYDCRCDKWTEV